MAVRKIVSMLLIGTMLFFAPSMIPARALTSVGPCGLGPSGWITGDTAFAGPSAIKPCPAPTSSHAISGWFWGTFACPASIVLSALVADFRDNRQLTTLEAWTCGVAFWLAKPASQQAPAR